jgi:hypothetical protein
MITYPPERLDFDATNLPPAVLAAFEEVIACHAAGCYVPAGIMVRKTLEELCKDRAAKGNLKERIGDLRSKVLSRKSCWTVSTISGCSVTTLHTSSPRSSFDWARTRSSCRSSSPRKCCRRSTSTTTCSLASGR